VNAVDCGAPSIGDRAGQRGFRDRFAAVSDWLEAKAEAERGQLPLWLPVGLGLGIAAYFILPDRHAWIGFLLLSLGIVLTAVDVMTLVDYAIVFSIVVLPLTYLPLMLLARDKKYMGKYVNGRLANSLGWLFFAIVTAAAVAAVPLYVLTSGGQA